MSDDGMDLCGAFWNHQVTMQRLLSLLRQSQNTCTDTECFAPIQTTPPNDGFMVMTLCWMAIAFFLYMLRPASNRNRERNLKPPRDSDGHGEGGGNPPASPNAI